MTYIRFQNRLGQVKKALKLAQNSNLGRSSALLIGSSSSVSSTRDQHHPFRQNSDFLYLTGSLAKDAVLIISTELPRPVLIGTSQDKAKAVWEGPGTNLSLLAKNLKADFVETKAIDSEVYKNLQKVDLLYFSTEQTSLASKIASNIFSLASHRRGNLPKMFSHSDVILEPLRLQKDKDEVASIVAANKITNAAILCALPFIRAGRTEASLAATIDYSFKLQDAEPAFNSIVASGKNAATLHHTPGNSKLRNGDMLLLDIGARFENYCADITRVVPVGKPFSSVHKEIYEIVLASQLAALKKVKAGISAKTVYDVAVKELAVGLKELGVLKTKVSTIISKQLYKPYFPHGIGHTLGLDVHDIGNIRGDPSIKLEKGMVITIEPGLYFAKATKTVPACGVRIEDNVLVKDGTSQVLSKGFPKEVDEIEKLLF